MEETGITLSLNVAETFNCSISEKTDPLENNYIAQPFEKNLLSEMRKAKSLYCCLDPNYSNMAKNRLEWLMIAEKCKKTVSQCVEKWHSLLRIYFSLTPECSWVYKQDFEKFEPYLYNHKLQTPSRAQRYHFLTKLWYKRNDLQKPGSTPEEHQIIWFEIVTECNDITPGAIMSVINWQKYWILAKNNFGERFYTLKEIEEKSTENLDAKFSEEETKIIEICNANTRDSLTNIIIALEKNFELGLNEKAIFPKCKKCFKQPNEILFRGSCSNCLKRPLFCDLCENGGASAVYNLIEWSMEALELLPDKLVSSHTKRISVCTQCKDKLNSKATINWKVCRVCETSQPLLLESLHSSKNNKLRKTVKEITRTEFSQKDGLPGFICKDCVKQINKLNKFVEKFRRTQVRLRHIHMKRFIGTPLDHQKSQILFDKLLPKKTEEVITVALKKLTPNVLKILTNKFSSTTKMETVKLTPIRTSANCDIIHDFQKSESKETTGDTLMTLSATELPAPAIKDVFSLKESDQQKTIQSDTCTIPIADVRKKIVKKFPFIEVVPVKLIPNRKSASCEIIPEQKNESKKIPDDTPKVFPELAFKDIFSLQESDRQKKIQSNKSVVSVVGPLKSYKIDSGTSILSQPMQSEEPISDSTLTKISVNTKKKLPTLPIQKLPTKTSIDTKKTSPWFASKASKSLSTPQKSVPKKIMKLSPTTASKPAIFTLPIATQHVLSERAASTTDYETIEDAPPVFCIPKNGNFSTDADKSGLSIIKMIKIEKKLEDNVEYKAAESTKYLKEEIYDPNEDLPEHHNPFQHVLECENNTIEFRINGELVVVKPHPYFPDTFVQVDTNGQHQNSETGKIIRLKPKIIRKVNNLINSTHAPMPISKKLPVKIKSVNKEEQQQGIKKPRKYWGTVNEFQAKKLPVYPNTRVIKSFDKSGVIESSADPSFQIPSKAQIKEDILTAIAKATTEAVAFDKSGVDSSIHPSIGSPLKIQIKEEILCDNTDALAKEDHVSEKSTVKQAYKRRAEIFVGNAPNSRVKRSYKKRAITTLSGGIDRNAKVKRAYKRRAITLIDGNIAPNTRIESGYKRRDVNGVHNTSEVQIKQEILNNDDTTDPMAPCKNQSSVSNCINQQYTLNENLKLRSCFKQRNLRVIIKRDKRLQVMASKYAWCSQ